MIIPGSLKQLRFYTSILMGSSILIIGGGPSTLEEERWKDLQTDVVMTVSTAYLNKTIQKTKTDFHIISTQTDFSCNEFDKWSKFNPECQFVVETNHLWKTPKGMNLFRFKKDPLKIRIEPDFKVGVMGRALTWMISTEQFKDIYFVGFDGYSKEGKAQHAFYKDVKGVKPDATINSYEKFYELYKSFSEYLISFLKNKNVNLHNLGKGHPANILTDLNNPYIK